MSLAAQSLSLAAYHRLQGCAAGTRWGPALQWAQWAPPAGRGRGASGAWVTLGLGADLLPSHWPRQIRPNPWSEPVPVRCLPAITDGRTQAWVRVSNADSPFGPGTLGALMQGRDAAATRLALTAGHVVGGTGSAHRLDRVDFSIDVQTLAEGRVHGWAPSFDASGIDSPIDAAAVRIDAATAALLQARSALPLGWADATAGQPLRLLARDQVLRAHAVGLLSAFMRVGEDDGLRYRLVEGLCYEVDGGSRPGDSGAAVWDAADRLVAIHTGSAPDGAAGNAMASPIRRVLNWFGCDLVTRAGAVMSPPAAAPSMALQPLPPPGAVVARAGVPVHEPASAVDVLARTMWGEARGELEAGMAAVAHVVLNRRDARRWWGSTVEAVCHKPFQFSCWNEGDTNRGQLLRVTPDDAQFAAALRIASDLLALAPVDRARLDTTNHATHYHARGLSPLPNWARGKPPCQQIGRHVLYCGIA